MMELLPANARFDFLKYRGVAAVLSLLMIAGSLFLWFDKGDEKYGTDFSGGHEFLIKFTTDTDAGRIRSLLGEQGFEEPRVQAFMGEEKDFSVRLNELGTSQEVRTKVETALKTTFPDKFEVLKADYVGPTVGKELRMKAFIAIGISLIGILLYIAFRFEFSVGLGTIVALAHDVVIATGVYLIAGHTISMSALAAALTIVGYSVNDTVVIFDRVREERRKQKNYDLRTLVNEAINFTLSRTIITHILTFFAALALYMFGGGEIADLSLYLCTGILCGAYSTIFVVAPVYVIWENRRNKVPVRTETAVKAV